MGSMTRWTGAMLLGLSLSSAARAQDPTDSRQGFYISGGLGYGSATASASGCCVSGSATESGTATYLALGGTISPRWRLGVEINGVSKDLGSGYTETVAYFVAAAAWYPSVTGEFWVKPMAGYGELDIANGGNSSSAGGFATGIGLGYDWHPSHSKVVVIPFATYMQQITAGQFTGSGIAARTNLFMIGLGVGYKH